MTSDEHPVTRSVVRRSPEQGSALAARSRKATKRKRQGREEGRPEGQAREQIRRRRARTSRRQKTIRTRQGQGQRQGKDQESRRRSQSTSTHRPAHSGPADSGEELRQPAAQARKACCFWLEARWCSRTMSHNRRFDPEVRFDKRARPRQSSTASTISPFRRRRKTSLQTGRQLVHRPPTDRAGPPKPGDGTLKTRRMEVMLTRAPSGTRCTTRSGASSATSSTTRTSTASISTKAEKKYRALPRRISQSRDDLNYLFAEMLSEHHRRPHVRARRRQRRNLKR